MPDIKDYQISQAEVQSNGVVSAPDTLTTSATESKKIFDKLPAFIVTKYNQLIDYIKSFYPSKAEVNTAINQRIVDIGSSDMTQAVYDPTGKRTDIYSYGYSKAESNATFAPINNPVFKGIPKIGANPITDTNTQTLEPKNNWTSNNCKITKIGTRCFLSTLLSNGDTTAGLGIIFLPTEFMPDTQQQIPCYYGGPTYTVNTLQINTDGAVRIVNTLEKPTGAGSNLIINATYNLV